jgi:N utilization substance protein B
VDIHHQCIFLPRAKFSSNMLSRRLIRIKVFQQLYAFMQEEGVTVEKAQKSLIKSLNATEVTFRNFFIFPLEFAHFVKVMMNPKDYKYVLLEKDVQKHKFLSLTKVYDKFLEDDTVERMLSKPYYPWQEQDALMRQVYKEIEDEPFYQNLIQSEGTLKDELDFLESFYEFLVQLDSFDQQMEEFHVNWEDEQDTVLRNVQKQLDKFKSKGKLNLPQTSKSHEEDFAFGTELLKLSLSSFEQNEKWIDDHTPGWDKDRIAKTDLILMVMAITELTQFEEVPEKVTMNEYIEIAKDYSTPQSGKFVNGILDKLLKVLKNQDLIHKRGKGLM